MNLVILILANVVVVVMSDGARRLFVRPKNVSGDNYTPFAWGALHEPSNQFGCQRLINKIENFLEKLHEYFARSPKRLIEFTKRFELVQTQGLKNIKIVKTRWMSTISLLECVRNEYCTLMQNMYNDIEDSTTTHQSCEVAKGCFELLVDVSIPITLSCFLPLLAIVHHLVKFSQHMDFPICNYLAVVTICYRKLYHLYYDHATSFCSNAFQ